MPQKNLRSLCDTALLGGLGTGCLKFRKDASNEFSGIVKTSNGNVSDKTPSNLNPLSFFAAAKFDGKKDFTCVSLKGSKEQNENLKGCSPVKEFKQNFPFTNITFDTEKLKGVAISLEAFNPTIPHNAIDSAIPAAFFEFTISNNTDVNATVSLCACLKSFFSAGKSEYGYDIRSGTSYTILSESSRSVSVRRKGSMCIATDSAHFTYETTGDLTAENFFEHFCEKDGFLSDNEQNNAEEPIRNISAMLSCHAVINPCSEAKIRFIVAWSFPYSSDRAMGYAERNHYYHYFPDVLSCATYCIDHFERLKKESALMRSFIESSCMPENVRDMLRFLMGSIKSPYIRRDSMGTLSGIPENNTEVCHSAITFTLDYLFPGIAATSAEQALRGLIYAKGKSDETGDFMPSAYDTDCSAEQIYSRLMMIIRLYSNYRRRSELKFFSENWVDIAYMADILCRTALHYDMSCPEFMKVYPAVLCTLKAMIDISDVLCDKKRGIYYLDLFNCAKSAFEIFINSKNPNMGRYLLSTQFIAGFMCGMKLYSDDAIDFAVNNTQFSDGDIDFYTCASLARYGYTDVSLNTLETLLEKDMPVSEQKLYDIAMQCCVMIPAFSGFDYDKNKMTVSFCPHDASSDSEGVFKSFISFDGAYGYVEQGIDYIEILLRSGEVKVRKFICSHRPYKAMYAGRIWYCDIERNTVTLDSNLAVTKSKKLTMLIDITK